MNTIIDILGRSILLRWDLDYNLLRTVMVIIFACLDTINGMYRRSERFFP